MSQLIKKSIAAPILIGLGCYVLLKIGNPLGPFLFALGLLGICYLNLNLFTGKCGFFLQEKIPLTDLIEILLINIMSGICIGIIISIIDPTLIASAQARVINWSFSLQFFIQSILCGIIMYTAVAMYKKGTALGIVFGIPLFILCGMQHSIANAVYFGIAGMGNWLLILFCALGNWIGSMIMWLFCYEGVKNESRIKKH